MTSISKNVYIDKLASIVNEYNNTYHRAVKMKPVLVKSITHIDFGIENNEKDQKFKFVERARISKYKNIFAKGYTPRWSKEAFVIKKVSNTVPWRYILSYLNGKEIVGTFYKQRIPEDKSNKI